MLSDSFLSLTGTIPSKFVVRNITISGHSIKGLQYNLKYLRGLATTKARSLMKRAQT